DEIAQANLGRIDPELTGGAVYQPLDHENRGRPPDAAIGTERRLAGRDAARTSAIGRDPVRPRQEAERLHGLDGGGPRIDRVGADIRGDLRTEPDDRPVAVHAELGLDDLVPGVRGRKEIPAAIADP